MKFFCSLLAMVLFTAIGCTAQDLRADFCGTYECKNSLYQSFVFDGKGKVKISAGISDVWRDFFQYNDTLAIYPDKDVFRFIVQQNGSLKGISNWVKDSVWNKIDKDSVKCTQLAAVTQERLQHMYTFEQVMNASGKGERTPEDNVRIMGVLSNLCDQQYGRACNTLGMMSLFTQGEAKSLAIWAKGCAANDANSCKNMADQYRSKKDIAKAKIYYAKACKLGDFGACNWDFEEKLKKLSKPAMRHK